MNNGNTHEAKCVLASRCKVAGSIRCNAQCPSFIAVHGASGSGGRSAATGLPREYRYMTLENSPVATEQPKIYETLTKYIQTFERQFEAGDNARIKSLYLYSESPGTGKTTTASALINEYLIANYIGSLKRGRQALQKPAVMLDVNQFQTDYNLATMTNDEAAMNEIKATIKRTQLAPFACLDDIGVRSASEAFRSYIHAIINWRTTNGLPTVFTSNIPLDDMKTVFDWRLQDRMRDQCLTIEFGGESKRGVRR